MTPRFLLDEHISPTAARHAQGLGVDVTCVVGSPLAGTDDRPLLEAAARDGRILVTCDLHDFVDILSQLMKEGTSIPGIVFVDARSFPTNRPERLASALVFLAGEIAAGRQDASFGLFLRHLDS